MPDLFRVDPKYPFNTPANQSTIQARPKSLIPQRATEGTYGQKLQQDMDAFGMPLGLIGALSPGSLLQASGAGPAVEGALGYALRAPKTIKDLAAHVLAGKPNPSDPDQEGWPWNRGKKDEWPLRPPITKVTKEQMDAEKLRKDLTALATSPEQGAEQAGQSAFSPYSPMNVPGLPPMIGGANPNFQSARDALGPARPAQKLGKSERMGRTLGAGAAGGLQAAQNVTGRQAGLGEILAGIAAGTGGEVAAMNAENRQLEELAASSAELRNRQLSSIAMTEEAAKANKSQAEAEEFNRRGLQEAGMKMQVGMHNASMMRIVPGGNGTFLDPRTGEVISTEQGNLKEMLQTVILMSEVAKMEGTLTGGVLSANLMMDNLTPERRPSALAAMMAIDQRAVVPEMIEYLKSSEDDLKKDLADRVEQYMSGAFAGDDDLSQMILTSLVSEIANVYQQDLTREPGSTPILSSSDYYHQQASQVFDVSPVGMLQMLMGGELGAGLSGGQQGYTPDMLK
jgi:hypothetical protein